MEIKDKGGRPLLFDSVEELQAKIDLYFSECDKGREKEYFSKKTGGVVKVMERVPYTITGLASYLGTNRQTLVNYENKSEFFDTIKKAKEKIEADMEQRALMGDSNPTISIFSMKNNFNWKDKTENETTHTFTSIEVDDNAGEET